MIRLFLRRPRGGGLLCGFEVRGRLLGSSRSAKGLFYNLVFARSRPVCECGVCVREREDMGTGI